MRYRLGEIIRCGGFVTNEKFLLGQNLREIEKRLGYHSGRLMQGAYFLHFNIRPTLQDLSLEPVGYSNVAGHHFSFPERLDKKKLQENIVNYWQENHIILLKVIPFIGHDNAMVNDLQYPSGSGVPQWKLTKEYPAEIIAIFDLNDYINHRPFRGKTFSNFKNN